MKTKVVFLALTVLIAFSVGCAKQPGPSTTPSSTAKAGTPPDVVTTASIVDNGAAFENAISKNGTWDYCHNQGSDH